MKFFTKLFLLIFIAGSITFAREVQAGYTPYACIMRYAKRLNAYQGTTIDDAALCKQWGESFGQICTFVGYYIPASWTNLSEPGGPSASIYRKAGVYDCTGGPAPTPNTCTDAAHTALVTFPATLRVPRDAAPGTLLTSWTAADTSDNWSCSVAVNNYLSSWLDLDAVPAKTVNAGGEAYAVIATGISGVGVIARYRLVATDATGKSALDASGPAGGTLVGGKSKNTGSVQVTAAAMNPVRLVQTISLALVRTDSPLSAGTIMGAAIGNTAASIASTAAAGALQYKHAVKYSTVNIIQGTCQTPDVVVPMGDVSLSLFRGAGVKTGNWIDRTFSVNNCPAGLNHVRVNFRTPQAGWLDASNRVFKLNNPDASTTAQGIGIQMYFGAGKGIATYESPQELTGYQAIAAQGGSFSVPVGARYYKPASSTTVSAGSANGTVTFDMIYD